MTRTAAWLAGAVAGLFLFSGPATGQDTSQMKQKPTSAASKAAGTSASAKGTTPKSADPTEPVVGAVLVVLPVAQASADALGDGCWVRFYDHRNYLGSNLTLVGPVDMPSMTVPGAAWRDWDSAMVGPKARVTTFDNVGFRDRTASLSPGQRIPDLHDDKLGWFDEVHSARVTCSG